MRKSPLEEATLVKPFNEFERSNKNLLRGPEAYPLLEIQSGPKQGTWFTLTHQKEISLGRANVNSIVLEDNSVSRSHAVIHELDGKYFIKDVGSRNGSFVNEKKIQEDFLLKHGDRIKLGIYVLKFLTEPEEEAAVEEEPAEEATEMEEIASHPAIIPPPDSTPTEMDVPHEEEKEEKTKPGKREAVLSKALEAKTGGPEKAVPAASKEKRGLKNLLYFLVALILIGGMGYTVYRFYIKKKATVAQKTTKMTPPKKVEETTPVTPPVAVTPPSVPEVQPPVQTQTQPSPTAIVTPPTVSPVQVPTPPSVSGVPVIMDVDAKPLQAKIIFQGKELGTTPFKTNISVPLGVPQDLTAIYHFAELNQDFSEKKTFTISKQDELVTLRFEGTLGALHFKGLPKDTQVYLEGNYSSPQLKSQAVKLSDIVYTRPIYLPFGNYTMEIKRPEKMEGGDTVVDVVKYRREFAITKEAPNYDFNLSEKDLSVFPAKIVTRPGAAEVWVDGKKYGETPFDGALPLGKHNLILKKEGYYDYNQPLTMTMNTPFSSEVTLKTSEAGQFINKGRDLIRQGQHPQAIDQLAEALKHNPSAGEMGQIQTLLGQSYIKTGQFDIAMGYFEKAKATEGFKSVADLGIAEASFNAGNKDLALARVIDVMLNEKNEKIKSDAETLFHKISPLKSVILVSTEPAGAKVSINGQEIPQPSPLVLSDLSLGSYRVTIEKEGFKRFESRFQLGISTFKPLILKMEPAP